MASPEEPHEKASTKLPQVHVIQELLSPIPDLLLLKEKMIVNGLPSSQDAMFPLVDVTEVTNEPEKSREKEDGFEDRSGVGKSQELEESWKDRKDKKKLGSRTVVPLEQISSSDSSWLSETEELRNNPPRGRSSTREKSNTNGNSPTNSEKVLRLSPTRLGELLRDTPTPFSLHPSQNQSSPLMTSPSITSPTRHRSTTNPTTTSPIAAKSLPFIRPQFSTQERTLSTPPGMKRSKSFPRALQLNTQTSPPRVPQISQQRGRPIEKGSDVMSPQKLPASTSKTPQPSADGPRTHTLSPKSSTSSSTRNPQNRRDSNPQSSTHPPTTTHLLKSASSAPPSSFPPLPLQTYLSLALASPTSHTSPSTFQSSQSSGPTSSTIHNPPQHHPDDSAAIAFERITNFLILPAKLEGALWFGMLACLDSWLYMFTILPLRFVRALGVLCAFWWGGIKSSLSWRGKTSRSRRRSSSSGSKNESSGMDKSKRDTAPISAKLKRAKRVSDLQPSHKADILRGLVVFTSCWILMRFDASRMYHSIKGQSGIKLYVIYNMLEISDRLCSALGQDIFECLFSKETLERGPDGRSKVLRPLGFFLLALAYNTLHSTALFYQVITLNVAVNSYSNALLTLLLSVQFVEIKSTVFKKFEKESLFQLTCGDIVERFQLWLMLVIIASRNLVEIGVWSLAGDDASTSSGSGAGIMPQSFTIFPEWTGQIMGPFLLVLGSEMLVDWLKHAYITKFNNTRPAVYERFLDVLCKDYYSHAFADQNLTKRLGLPVIPLACLFIRASLQTYQMFLATHIPLPLPSVTTSLSESNASPVTTATLANFDAILRRALGRSSFGGSLAPGLDSSSDNLMAIAMLLIFFLGFFLVFLAVKLVLGICLLTFARKRYKGMKERAGMNFLTGARPVGGFGLIGVSDDQKKWIYADDPAGERAMKERMNRPPPREIDLDTVKRYSMAAKRIW